MISVRRHTFETNSSSTHNISIASKSDWEKFKDGVLYFSKEHCEIISLEEVMNSEYFEDYYDFEDDKEVTAEDVKSWIEENAYEDYFPFQSYEYMDMPYEEVFDSNGNPIVVYSYYFYN